jgi:hypothetical protein
MITPAAALSVLSGNVVVAPLGEVTVTLARGDISVRARLTSKLSLGMQGLAGTAETRQTVVSAFAGAKHAQEASSATDDASK